MKLMWAVVMLVTGGIGLAVLLSQPAPALVSVAGNNNTVVAVENGFNCGYSNKLTEHWNLLLNEGLPKEEVYLCVRKAR